MTNTYDLRNRCEIATQRDGDRFVGIKANTDDIKVYFPLGYQLPNTNDELRKEIFHLFNILNEFLDNKDRPIYFNKSSADESVVFPLTAYLEIINYYMEKGYYIERESLYRTKDKGKINWTKTIQKQKPLLCKNKNMDSYSLIYTTYTVRDSMPNVNKEITNIHMHCVYESFKKIGWLFTPNMPKKPDGTLNAKRFLNVLRNKLGHTNNDVKKRLFQSMIDMLEFMDKNTNNTQFYFGTDNFETIWEKLIDKAFGIKNKESYFPKSKWNLQYGKTKSLHPLQPDTIMIYKDNVYVLDAKYYKYGATGNPQDLPNASSINKQITYGEYLHKTKDVNADNIFNAFLLPYNKEKNYFNSNDNYLNIGEAIGEWKNNSLKYEHIQGILVDIKYLMYNYTGDTKYNILQLADSIENAFKENKQNFTD